MCKLEQRQGSEEATVRGGGVRLRRLSARWAGGAAVPWPCAPRVHSQELGLDAPPAFALFLCLESQ